MFSFLNSKKSLVKTSFFKGLCDFHSHILPNVDDGVQTDDEAIEILDFYEELGYEKVIFTPHVMEDLAQNDFEYLSRRFECFKEQYKGGLQLSLGAEYMLDAGFNKHLEQGKMLTLRDNLLLVEFSYAFAPLDAKGSLQNILSKGYFPVLAHPERYLYLRESDYKQFKSMGVRFQLNLPSLLGMYGSNVKKRAQWMLPQGLYSFVGSDIHSLARFKNALLSVNLSKKELQQLSKVVF